MSGSFLDTNIIIDWFRGNNGALNSYIENNELQVPIFVIGELYYGAENSKNPSKHISQVEKLSNFFEIVNSTKETANFYAKIKSQLKKSGKPIPENDIWIAAICLEHNKSLVTNDSHFLNIKGLEIINLK